MLHGSWLLLCCRIQHVHDDGGGHRVGGAAGIVAVVALVRPLHLEHAGGSTFLDLDSRIVVDHALFMVPEDVGRWFRGVLQGTHQT